MKVNVRVKYSLLDYHLSIEFPSFLKGILASGLSLFSVTYTLVNDQGNVVKKTPNLKLGFWAATITLILCLTKVITWHIHPILTVLLVYVAFDLVSVGINYLERSAWIAQAKYANKNN